MIDLGIILSWLRYRKVVKSRRVAERVLKDLHSLTVTIHGRLMLSEVCHDEDNGLAPELRRIYWVLLQNAPVETWSERN